LITNPYCGACGHVYCYSCLVGEVAGEEGDGWACLRCGETIKHVRRWVEVVEKEGESEGTEEKGEKGEEGSDSSRDGEQSENTEEKVEIMTPDEETLQDAELVDEEEDEVQSEKTEDDNLFSR